MAAGESRAEEIGVPCNIAVVDAGAHLVAHIRMDGSQLGSITHAIDKAFTSCAYRRSTEALGRDGQPAAPLYGVANSHQGRVVIFAGGIPLVHASRVAGAVGVSGGTIGEDRSVAEAAFAAF
ncbi:heme-binding protein [Streptomyces sp. CWNU-1]|uniref:Heme-binding protein n=2 Tax=Streptomyces albipurpureus TaxID=2897419 RepID=A0ABT0UJD4_9ACTN|nr:heme-binding protein [Streptomyces sp. CWNU-1]